MKIDLYHSIRWSRYKAIVFSELYRIAKNSEFSFRFIQIADTSNNRTSLSPVELSYHQYEHTLLFPGSYEEIPAWKIASTLFFKTLRSNSNLILIPGFDAPEHWAMLIACMMSCKRRATFCDSTLLDRRQSKLKSYFKRFFFSRCSGVFCYGERARQYLAHYGVPSTRIFKRCQAAALPASYDEQNIPEFRVRAAAPTNSPTFLYVGRLSQEKGLDTLVHAFASIKSQLKQARLVLVGGGPLKQQLQELAQGQGIADDVVFTGGTTQDALADHYLSATCLVLPSRSEPWGLVVNEALHYGCPVVVSDRCGCVPELVQEGRTGYAFPANDIAALAERLLKVAAEAADTRAVAQRCLDVIRPYSPTAAAMQMLEGCRAMLTEAVR